MPGPAVRQRVLTQAQRIVVKVGTSSLTGPKGRLELAAVRRLCEQITAVMRRGVKVTLVSSGAIGAGIGELDLAERPTDLALLQAVAAVGQGQLMRVFHDEMAGRGVKVAQVLLSRDDFESRSRYLNIRNTLGALHEFGVLPILNENDAVTVDEIRYGDNDEIAAHVTNMLGADALILLTHVGGVLDANGQIVPTIHQVDDDAQALVRDEKSALGSGGMATKLAAAGLVTSAGEVAVIADPAVENVLEALLDGEEIGTVFLPADRKLSSKRRWIGQIAKPAGAIVVDDGAVRALVERGKSLLPSGIVEVRGQFEKGDTVSVETADGREIARGLTNYDADDLRAIRGLHSDRIAETLGNAPYAEAIHRNNLALL